MPGKQDGVFAIVQARTGSTRLPGKVLRPLLGRPMLARVIERLLRAKTLSGVVIATTTLPQDEPLARLCGEMGIPAARGDEADVLGRYLAAADSVGARVVVRVTSDCPLIDPEVLDRLVATFLAAPDALDYVSNTIERTYPRGLDAEVLPRRVLERLGRDSRSAEEREHVTLHLLRHRDRYRIAQVRADADYSGHYWTVDTEEDFRLVERIYEEIHPRRPAFTWEDALALVEARPELSLINRRQSIVNEMKHRAIDRSA